MPKRCADVLTTLAAQSLKHTVHSIPTSPKRSRFLIDDLLQMPSAGAESDDDEASEKPSASEFPIISINVEDEDEALRTLTPASTTDNSALTTDTAELQSTPNWPPAGASSLLANVECQLEGRELWAKFYKLSTEMIITKSGRRMFPTVKVRLENCDIDAHYYVFLDVVPVDARRYRYVYNKSAWLTAGKAETSPRSRLYMHPDSPFTGRQLATQVISFEKAKLTNNDVDRVGHLVLNSMHKYQPRVHVVRRERTQKPLNGNSTLFDLNAEHYKTFQFTETQFMAVTAYQNQLITKLKIEKNPFAKGFRDPTGRNGDLCEISRHFMENLPMRPPFDPLFFFQQCWPTSSLVDSTNLPKLFGIPVPLPGEMQRLTGEQCQTKTDEQQKDSGDTADSDVSTTSGKDLASKTCANRQSSPPTFNNKHVRPLIPPQIPTNSMPNFMSALGLLNPQQWSALLNGTIGQVAASEENTSLTDTRGEKSTAEV